MPENSISNKDAKDGDLEKKILEEARSRFDKAKQAWAENQKLANEDDKFLSGIQWPSDIKSQREADGRPCLTINKISQAVNQITNDQRQNRPSIKVHPVDDIADPETARVRQGLIRHIEYDSNADYAYDTAFALVASGGFSFFRVIAEYVSPESFDQKLRIKRIRNRNSVLLDPNHQEPDGSDASYGFIDDYLTKDEFKRLYPNSELCSDDHGWGGDPEWVQEDSIRIAEYYYKEYKKRTLCQLASGQSCFEEDLEKALAIQLQNGIQDRVVKTRETDVPTIKWCKINGSEILESTDWPGQYIPIIPVYGSELLVDGKLVLKGIVRDAIDPARMYNVWTSAEAEAIGLAPKAPFVADAKSIEGYEQIWASANKKNYSYLPYNSIVNGVAVPPPSRQSADVSTAAITQARMLASDDIKATTGIYDAALGAKSNETSGVAINQRKNQAQTSNFHLIDNLTRSIRHCGRILNDAIPFYYDTARTERIIGDEGDHKTVKLNEEFEEGGKMVTYRMDTGRYDVTVDTGPSFQTKRQEAAASMMDLSRAAPQLMQVAGDLMIKNMDWPGATEIAERFKKSLPPGLAEDKDQEKQIPPEVQAKMQQMDQMVAQLTGQVHQLQDEKEQKLIELQSKERIEFAKIEADLQKTILTVESKESVELLKHEVASAKHMIDLFHDQMAQLTQQSQFNSPPQGQQVPNSQPDAGDSFADQQMGAQPTGGFSPGQSMEGQPTP